MAFHFEGFGVWCIWLQSLGLRVREPYGILFRATPRGGRFRVESALEIHGL